MTTYQQLATDYHPRFGDSRGIVNGRLVIEFHQRDEIRAGTLVCEPFTESELTDWRDHNYTEDAYPYYSTTIDGVLYHTQGNFTPRN